MGAHLSTNVAEGRAFMQIVGGKPVDSLSGERIEVVCPSDGKVFASIPASGKADVDRAVHRRAPRFRRWAMEQDAGVRARASADQAVSPRRG